MAEIPTSGKPHEKDRDPVDVVIIVAGIIVGGLILYGFISMLIPLVTYHASTIQDDSTNNNGISVTSDTYSNSGVTNSDTASSTPIDTTPPSCPTCFNLSSNNQSKILPTQTTFSLELPEAIYHRQNVLLFGNPTGSVIVIGDEQSDREGYWKINYKANAKGEGDIVVPSASTSTVYFKLSIVVE